MNIDNIRPNKKKALILAKRSLAELVCDAVNLEGINRTVISIMSEWIFQL